MFANKLQVLTVGGFDETQHVGFWKPFVQNKSNIFGKNTPKSPNICLTVAFYDFCAVSPIELPFSLVLRLDHLHSFH